MKLSHWLGWGGNILLISGLILIGFKWPYAFLLTAVGEVLWLWESIRLKRLDMIVLCAVFTVVAVFNWLLWMFL